MARYPERTPPRWTLATALCLALLWSPPSRAVSFDHPEQERAAEGAKASLKILGRDPVHLPAGHVAVYAVAGDLDADQLEDVVVVTKSEAGYALLIYLQGPKGAFREVFRSQKLVSENGGAMGQAPDDETPFSGVPQIVKGVLLVTSESSGATESSRETEKLRWDAKLRAFRRIGYTGIEEECSMGPTPDCSSQKTDINFVTRKMVFGKRTCRLPDDYRVPAPDEELQLPKCAKPAR